MWLDLGNKCRMKIFLLSFRSRQSEEHDRVWIKSVSHLVMELLLFEDVHAWNTETLQAYISCREVPPFVKSYHKWSVLSAEKLWIWPLHWLHHMCDSYTLCCASCATVKCAPNLSKVPTARFLAAALSQWRLSWTGFLNGFPGRVIDQLSRVVNYSVVVHWPC
jgi:hypothetical protein